MFRSFLTVILAVLMAGFGVEPMEAQYPAPGSYPAQPYPQQGPYSQDPQSVQSGSYPQQYPQAQAQYPQGPQQQYPGYAQGPQQQYPQAGPNGQEPAAQGNDQQHGVARLSIVQGDVNLKLASTGELASAAVNAPVVAQDRVQTSPGSRAEVELDSANLLRLAPNTDVGFADLEYHRYQVQLGAGTISYRVLRDSDAQAEIDTPSIAVHPAQRGEYRISVLDDGTTQITVRAGAADILSPRGSQRLEAGHTTLVRGNPSDPEFQTSYELAHDQFDDWCAGRDHELLASQSYNYVNRDVYGADDLDAYGNWVPSQYGQVWAPRPPVPDWSPYSYGQWSYVDDYYGWSWVDYAPWGWAPYHYGRWFWNTGYGWCWWPGARFGVSLWSPALVGFFGWGGGVGVWAGLGWVALAPFEAFHAWWGHGLFGRGGFGFRGGFGYGFERNANIASMYRNAAIRGGAMTAAFDRFGGPGQRFSPATRAQLSNASLFHGGVPVSPNRGGFQFSNRQAMANPRLASVAGRQFFHAGQGIGSGARFNALGAAHGVAPNMQRSGSTRSVYSTPSGASGGWQRFGAPGNAGSLRQGFGNAQEQSGWHQFGQPQGSASGGYSGGARAGAAQSNYGRSYEQGNSGAHYQSRPQGGNPTAAQPRSSSPGTGGYNGGYSGGRSAFTAPRYSAPAAPHYSAPSAPHYSAPSSHSGGGASHSGGESRGGGGESHGGGGGHSSSGGHHGR